MERDYRRCNGDLYFLLPGLQSSALIFFQSFRDALQVIGFYRADRTGIVESVNEHLTSHFVQDVLATNDHSNTCFGTVSSYSSFTW